MTFIKAIIWVILLIGMVIFAVNNWVPVSIALWGDQILDTKLPVLIIGAFFLGWLPTWLALKGSSWSAKRKIRKLTVQQQAAHMPAASEQIPVPVHAAMPTVGPITGPTTGDAV